MPTRAGGFAICVVNHGAEDLEVRKVYRVLQDKAAAATGYMRVIDESGEDYLYPADYFVLVELPEKARRAMTLPPAARQPAAITEQAASADQRSRCSRWPLSANVRHTADG